MTIQTTIDSHEVTKYQLGFNGSIDISDESAEQMELDNVTVFVVAAHAGKATFDILPDGEIRRKNTMKLSNASVLTGKLREQAIVLLASGQDQGYLNFPMPTYPPAGAPEVGEIQEVNGNRQIFFDGEWRNIEDTDVDPEDFDEAIAAHPGESGPKVAKFSDNRYDEIQDVKVVGTLRNGERKDRVLADFLDS